MPSAAAQHHDEMVAALNAQRERLFGGVEEDGWSGGRAERFRADPNREPEPVLKSILEYVRHDDAVLDVGGGAGRFALPIARHCREVMDVDPSAGMKAVFESVAAESGIKNARYMQSDWLDAAGVEADLSVVAHVTYFVAHIEAFIRKLDAATRRRVIINVSAVPNPNTGADLFRVIHDEDLALLPGHRELLPVLWDMGILPDVLVIGSTRGERFDAFATRDEAVNGVLGQGTTLWRLADGRERAQRAIESHFDEVFEKTDAGHRRRYQPDRRNVLITWSH
jgi:2-polyprenyl-3-methyl-5-hydroxy-6-metoxy-1,4-benzoquinol methylase